jgi:hypothetical protein
MGNIVLQKSLLDIKRALPLPIYEYKSVDLTKVDKMTNSHRKNFVPTVK